MRDTLGLGPHSQVVLLIKGLPVRVRADSPIGVVARRMREANVSAALVGADDAIVTERDLVRALAAGVGPEAEVALVAVAGPLAVGDQTSIVDAAAEMLRQEIRHLVVVEHGAVVGVVSLRDVMGVLLQALEPDRWVATLRAAVTGCTEQWIG
jgi:signal-transduction protein with cAMP-binding, CBS, and nucleotidyltransferase domain